MVMIMMLSASIIPIPIMIPAVLVLDPTLVAFPVTLEIFTVLIARSDPLGSRVRRLHPVNFVPSPVLSYRITIAVDPHIIRSGSLMKNTNHTRRWWWTDPDSNRKLRSKDFSSSQECNTEQNCHEKPV